MLATTYAIVGRYMDGVRVIGYDLETVGEGKRLRLPKKAVETLALNKQIINCTAQKYTDPKTNKVMVVLKGVGCKISDLPCININKPEKKDKRAVIVKRIVEGKYTYGYTVLTYSGEERDLTREQVMELARRGALKNARAQMLKGKLLLRGVNCELAKLPIKKVSEARLISR